MPTGLGNAYSWNGGLTPCVRWLLIGNTAIYVAQLLLDRLASGIFTGYLGLSVAGFMHGYYWQFLTYMFLHGSLMHLGLNMLMLFMIGPELERFMGRRGFLSLYFLSGLLGGLGWLTLAYPQEGLCVGASGAIFGILGAFAALFPRQPITLLLFFVLPLTVETWLLVAGLSLIQLLYLLNPGFGGVAYAAHLAGALAGYVYAFTAYRSDRWRAFVRRRTAPAQPEPADVDKLLDKVAEKGIHSLSRRERETLERASRR